MYSLYLGCVIPNMFPEVEFSVRWVLKRLGVDFDYLSGASCCFPPALFGFNEKAWIRVNERNLSLSKHDVIAACDECFASMQDAHNILRGVGRKLPNVLPLIKLLGDQVKSIKELTELDLGVRCAIQHSCHLLRPSKVRGVDDARSPKVVRSVLGAIGCDVVTYDGELSCCGGSIAGGSSASKDLAVRKLKSIEKSGADVVVTTCPHCMKQLSGQNPKIPILHVAQLCAFALGIPSEKVGLKILGDLAGAIHRK